MTGTEETIVTACGPCYKSAYTYFVWGKKHYVRSVTEWREKM